MRTATLTRLESGSAGTFGRLTTPEGFSCATVELPWRGNLKQKSCIPKGTYLCEMAESPHYGRAYHIRNVPDRDGILIHPANVGGDVDAGYDSQLLGCIALGAEVVMFHAGTKLNNKLTLKKAQRGVSASRPTVSAFADHMKAEPFELTITSTEDQ